MATKVTRAGARNSPPQSLSTLRGPPSMERPTVGPSRGPASKAARFLRRRRPSPDGDWRKEPGRRRQTGFSTEHAESPRPRRPKTKAPLPPKRQRRNPLRYHSSCRYPGRSSCEITVTPAAAYCPEGVQRGAPRGSSRRPSRRLAPNRRLSGGRKRRYLASSTQFSR